MSCFRHAVLPNARVEEDLCFPIRLLNAAQLKAELPRQLKETINYQLLVRCAYDYMENVIVAQGVSAPTCSVWIPRCC